MNTQFVEDYINLKMTKDESKIVFTFFELRVKNNLTEQQVNEFLKLSKIRLENLDYQVYFNGAEYEYQNSKKIVEDNELLVAIKKVKERTQTNGRKIKKTKHR